MRSMQSPPKTNKASRGSSLLTIYSSRSELLKALDWKTATLFAFKINNQGWSTYNTKYVIYNYTYNTPMNNTYYTQVFSENFDNLQ